MTNDELADYLEVLSQRARMLPKAYRDPNRYHEDRAEIGSELSLIGERLNPRPGRMNTDAVLRRARSYRLPEPRHV